LWFRCENTQHIVSKVLKENTQVFDRRTLVIEAGGAARAAVYAVIKENAKEIVIFNRTLERAKRLANDFGVAYRILNKVDELHRCDIILNMRSVGMIGATRHNMLTRYVVEVPKRKLSVLRAAVLI
jgi:shikimate 5-dehydrogenase